MADASGPFTVIMSFRARPETLGQVADEIIRNARASRSEPGCLEFTVLRDAADTGAFVLYERYRDEAAFREEHMATEHYARWKSVSARCLVDGSQRRHELLPVEEAVR